MGFFKKLFGKKETENNQPLGYDEFWIWFQQNHSSFFQVIKTHKNVEKDFIDIISPKLSAIHPELYNLTGMYDDHTAELIITADGNTQAIVFAEELVNVAPSVEGWKFTALKQPSDAEDLGIVMNNIEVNIQLLSFYANEYADKPDEVDISIVHNISGDEKTITNAIFILLDNFLGELNFVNNIDSLDVKKDDGSKELIPLQKLPDYINWRQKEFIEKYEGVRHHTDKDTYSALQGKTEKGDLLLAIINADLLQWDQKASHPWIAIIKFEYDDASGKGLPSAEDYELLTKIEDEIMLHLIDKEGYLNIGRHTGNSYREVYFACKDFRKPSKVFYEIELAYSKQFTISTEIYKDKYWQSFERYMPPTIPE